VKPFVKSNKNDFLDAEAIAEAVDRENMRFVPIKTDDQLDLQALHRVRDRLIARRTSVINQLRAFLLERGMTFAKTPAKLKLAMSEILENVDANLTLRMRNLVSLLWNEWKDLEQQIVSMNMEVEQIASSDPACQRLRKIPGIGPLVATAIVAAIGNGAAFHKGREFASWLGLVPRQHSTGGGQGCSASASAATATCARSSCTVPDQPSSASSENDRRSADGSMRSSKERRSTWSSRRRPTSSPALPGRFYQVVRNIAQQ
jgi:transposase